MSQQTSSLIILVLFIILLIALAFVGSTILMKRAFRAVIKMFRDHNALTIETAQWAQDIGLKRKSMLAFGGLRDYKPSVLQFLMKQDIVRTNEEGKVFLSEEALQRSGIETRLGVNR